MQLFPVKIYIPASSLEYSNNEISVVYNNMTVVGTRESLSMAEIINWGDACAPSVRCYENACVELAFNADEISEIYVTDVDHLIPVAKLLKEKHGFASISANIEGIEELMAYDPKDPSTNPIFCPDCGT